jgi:hypothetical protein
MRKVSSMEIGLGLSDLSRRTFYTIFDSVGSL